MHHHSEPQISSHPNAQTLKRLYAALAQGDLQTFFAGCSDKMTFQVPGKSKLAGKYTKDTFAQGFLIPMKELSGGSFKFEAHDILASDLHATVLGTEKLTRDGRIIESRTVHVWRFEQGQPVAWYEYPRDLYQFDAIWS